MKYDRDIAHFAGRESEVDRILETAAESKDLDNTFQKLHYDAFRKINCLECANCCKTTSPIITQDDMDRLSKALGISTGEFLQTYLEMDEDGDFVFHSAPCPMLNSDNSCRVYEDRPTACREYPHTNRKQMIEILDITSRNALICPAVSQIIRNLGSKKENR